MSHQKWYENNQQDLDAYESILMSEAGCMEGIIRGNICFCRKLCQNDFLSLYASQNPLSSDGTDNLRMNFAILTALISRICIENGLDYQESVRICGLYIRSLDHIRNQEEITGRFCQMVTDYCKRMRELVYEQNKTLPVRKAIRYISDHLTEHPVLSDVASSAGLSASYLSRKFHEETGSGITEWTHRMLAETAGLMIRYSDQSVSDVSGELGFSSVSNFIQVFSSENGRTPTRYRQEFRLDFSRQITSVTDAGKSDQPAEKNISLTGYYFPMNHNLPGISDYHLLDQEYATYEAVLEGDSDTLMKIRPGILEAMHEKLGILADDPLTDQKYYFLIIAAMIVRLCIYHRMDPAEAWHLADTCISRMNQADRPEAVQQLVKDLLLASAREMKQLHNRRQISEPIRQCIEYIYSHTTERIRTEDLSRACGKSVSWIAHTFPKETGISVKDYVQREKIASAKNMLHYTDLSFAEIASRLSFSSQSHFTLVFHNETGETPGEWRRKIRASENS